MPITLDYDAARQVLEEAFRRAEEDLLADREPKAPRDFRQNIESIFASSVQAYREVLLGCLVARSLDRGLDVHLPYTSQGELAFSGRSLDERVINPILHEERIPCTRGPYLSVFRRSVRFDNTVRDGLRDKAGYDALLKALDKVQSCSSEKKLRGFLTCVAFAFLKLREAASVPLSRLRMVSLEQCDTLIDLLIGKPSGGRFPVMLAVAAFSAIRERFGLDWEIEAQGINVADSASGAGGDITISVQGEVLMAAEVTERALDRSRVLATFNTKIAPSDIEDYLFLVKEKPSNAGVLEQARQYFAQGHDVNFLKIKHWIVGTLASLGRQGRQAFLANLIDQVDDQDTPRALKVAWNECVAVITAGPNEHYQSQGTD